MPVSATVPERGLADRSGLREAFWTNDRAQTDRWRDLLRVLWSTWVVIPAGIIFGTGVPSLGHWLTVNPVSSVVLAALVVLPLLLAPHRPLLAWRLSLLVTLLMVGFFDPRISDPWPFPLGQVFAYALTVVVAVAFASPRASLWVWGVSYLLVALFGSATAQLSCGLVILVLAGLTYLLKTMLLARRRLAEQVAESEVERARRTVLEERARIARDLHDVVAHHMSLVVVQAESAPYRVTDLPPAAVTEFASISASARAALTEIRSLLGVLRAEDQTQQLRPQPGIGDLGELVDNARRAGMDVQQDSSGQPEPLRPAADIAAYRIVQEALANAARHAAGATVLVSRRYDRERMELAVLTSAVPGGPAVGQSAAGAGHGLVGMGERAQSAGGAVQAGPTPDGGFAVRAWLPLAALVGSEPERP